MSSSPATAMLHALPAFSRGASNSGFRKRRNFNRAAGVLQRAKLTPSRKITVCRCSLGLLLASSSSGAAKRCLSKAEWREEAAKRGLPNLETTPKADPVLFCCSAQRLIVHLLMLTVGQMVQGLFSFHDRRF